MKALQVLVFEHRADLQELHRTTELEDVPSFRIALADLSRRLVRLISAVHRVWHRGPKRAMARLRSAGTVTGAWVTALDAFARIELDAGRLAAVASGATQLLTDVAQFAVGPGDERVAVRRGPSFWPAVDDLDVPALGET